MRFQNMSADGWTEKCCVAKKQTEFVDKGTESRKLYAKVQLRLST